MMESLLRDPKAGRNNPYLMFIAYTWNKIKEDIYQNLYEDEDPETVPDYDDFEIDGMECNAVVMRIIIESCASDLIAAQQNGLVLKIGGRPYRTPKTPAADRFTLCNRIFCFQRKDDIVRISKSDIMTVVMPDDSKTFMDIELENSMAMAHRILFLVETRKEGWDMLTDVEAVVYAWTIRMARYQGMRIKDIVNEVLRFVDYIKDGISEMELDELSDLWIDNFNTATVSADSQFSASKVDEWNRRYGMKSVLQEIDQEEADEFWLSNSGKLVRTCCTS